MESEEGAEVSNSVLGKKTLNKRCAVSRRFFVRTYSTNLAEKRIIPEFSVLIG